MLANCVGCVDGDLIVGLVAILDAQVVILEVDVKKRQDEGVFDVLPDDSGHFVAVELYDRADYLDF